MSEDDVELVPLPEADDCKSSMDLMSDALLSGDVDAISIWEPEPEGAIRQLCDDVIVFQDRSVCWEVFSLHTTATALADPDMLDVLEEALRDRQGSRLSAAQWSLASAMRASPILGQESSSSSAAYETYTVSGSPQPRTAAARSARCRCAAT